MSDMAPIIIYVTAANPDEAEKIALTVLEEKLVACVSTVRDIRSRYWWQGALCDSVEQLLIMKTTQAHLTAVIERVKALHSYEVPEIIAVPVIGGNPEYTRWIEGSVRPA